MIPAEQWQIYERFLDAAEAQGRRFALGGGFALAAYTGRWRNSKDMDVCVIPEEREPLIDLLRQIGCRDYFEVQPYDRSWIYRGYSDKAIIDIIWSMANKRAQVDERWLQGPEIDIRGRCHRVVPVEEMIWAKLYVLQRDRCDWTDALNLLYAAAGCIDWDHLIARLGEDAPLLKGALSVFSWMCPGRISDIPDAVRRRFELPAPAPETDTECFRVRLLDSRPWFSPLEPQPS